MKLKTLLFFVLIFLRFAEVFAITDCSQVTQIPSIECEALVALYNDTGGSGWYNNINWNADNTPCSWYGISCVSGHVYEIRLDNNGLIGLIPTELANLSNLNFLFLYGNQLSGSIPTELGNLSNLKFILLNNNQLSGSIPAELGNLSNLRFLSLYSNHISGSIPAELGNLSKLQSLFLLDNQFCGD